MDDRLRKFAQVVDSGSFTDAAKKLHISQPALTHAVNKLERELRAPLLLRHRKHLELTDAGHIAYAAAKEYQTSEENLRTKLAGLARQRPKVRVGMIDSVAVALNNAAGPLEKLESQADVSIVVNNSRYLRTAVENGQLDLAFAVRTVASNQNLEAETAGEELFTLVFHPERKEEVQAQLSNKKLLDFISYDQYSTTFGHLDSALRDRGITTRPVLYSTNPGIMMHTVLRGRGVAALPCLLTKEMVNSGKLDVVRQKRRVIRMSCPIDAVRRSGQIFPEALEIFLARAKNALDLANKSFS